jgi:hypothetical protein
MLAVQHAILSDERLQKYAEDDYKKWFPNTPVEDVDVLYRAIEFFKPRTFLEIGTNRGWTTAFLADAFPDMLIDTVDFPHEMSFLYSWSPHLPLGGGDFRKSDIGFHCKGKPNVRQLYGDSRLIKTYPVSAEYEGGFIDGSHRTEDVISDTLVFLAKRASTSKWFVVWHDAHFENVGTALRVIGSSMYVHLIAGTCCAFGSPNPQYGYEVFGDDALLLTP